MPECQKFLKVGLDQYGTERLGRLILPQLEKCGTERITAYFDDSLCSTVVYMYRPNWKETLLKEYDSVNQSVVMCAS